MDLHNGEQVYICSRQQFMLASDAGQSKVKNAQEKGSVEAGNSRSRTYIADNSLQASTVLYVGSTLLQSRFHL